MDLTLSPSEESFRDELRAWLAANHPGREPEGDDAGFAFRRAWQRKLHDGGWAGVSWPTEYGGRGATLVEQAIYNEEIVRAQAPSAANVLGLAMGGPTVIAHGSDEQKRRYLEPILSAEEIWCQGFSEPDSGSDLASVKTRAVRDGDDWLVTGQKVWTTLAHHAKWCMLVARTNPDAPKHQGLSYFLMDMEQDAVQVRPLRQITGEARVQRALHGGRADPARQHRRRRGQRLGGGHHHAHARARHAGLRAADRGQARARPAHRGGEGRRRDDRPAGPRPPGPALHRGRGPAPERLPRPHRDHARRRPGAGGLAGQVAVGRGQPGADRAGDGPARARAPSSYDDTWTYRFLRARANSIEGGTTEILKNIVAERVLGLPRMR